MDIVERLRRINAFLHVTEDEPEYDYKLSYEAANEIERLRDEVHFDVHTINALSENNDLLEAENKRLREALREILTHETDYEPYDCIEIARAALKEGE